MNGQHSESRAEFYLTLTNEEELVVKNCARRAGISFPAAIRFLLELGWRMAIGDISGEIYRIEQ